MQPVPFNRPCLTGGEWAYMSQAIANAHTSGDGPFTKACHALLERELGARKVLLTTNCTHALEMTALLLNLQPGDEVIMPAFTFVSTANAYVLRGAKPVFVDVRPDTLNLDERFVEQAITARTKAVVAVHYAGVACEMDSLKEICTPRGIALIEDNAHGLFGRYGEKMLGTLGTFATQSFHETKNFTCGEGGALVINDERYVESAEIIREKGTNRSRFFRGQVDKYTWVDQGSSYLPSDILAAFLLAQLEGREQIQGVRKRIWDTYAGGLSEWAETYGVVLPTVPEKCVPSYHLFFMLLPSMQERDRLIAHLARQGISSVFHYLPLNRSEVAKHLSVQAACPVAESASERLVRLPFFNELTVEMQTRAIEAIRSFAPVRV